MKTNNWKQLLRSMTCLLLALVLFANLALPAYAADSDKSDNDEDVILITTDDEDAIRELFKDANVTEEYIQEIIAIAKTADLSEPIVITRGKEAKLTELPEMYQTTTDAEKITETHLKTDWAELDWTNANDGYVKIKWTKKIVDRAFCTVRWIEDGTEQFIDYHLHKDANFDQWFKIPLTAGNTEYAVSIELFYTEDDLSDDKSDEELDAIWRELLMARFKPEMKDENGWMLLSSIRADFDNAPEAVKKAKELTKNCKTDSEKVAAIVKYVAKTLKYDRTLYNNEKKREANKDDTVMIRCDRDLNPDHILKAKKGVCEHYAVLATAMLRSLGIPCQTVNGWYKNSNGKTERHAWILVKPETGTLNVKALAGGTDPNPENDGWIRLDPTGMLTAPKATANNDRYDPYRYD